MYPVPQIQTGKMAIMPRPRGNDWLEDEIRGLKMAGVGVLVSLLSAAEERELELCSEARFAAEAGLTFVPFAIMDRSVPRQTGDYLEFIRRLYTLLQNGESMVIHCRAGIGRSGITAASLLIVDGCDARTAFDHVSRARGFEVPDTPEQKAWVSDLAKKLSMKPGLKCD